MLTKEKVLKNAETYHKKTTEYGVMNDKLIKMLGEGFISAPCMMGENQYCAYEGGLIAHMLNVTKEAMGINNSLPENKRVDTKTLVRVCLIHQIGKSKMYVEQTSKWHRENRGELYTFNDTLLSMSTGERSVYYLLNSGIDLTEDEVFAIYNYNEDFTNRPITKDGEKLANILRVANLLAIIHEKF
jgi:hypothetical protein